MATEWAGDVVRRESPRSQFARELALENTKQAGEDRRNLQSKYAASIAEQDKRDYEMALDTWKNFSNATGKQQEDIRQKTEAYTSLKKLFKRQGLQVFDDKGEIIFPPSKADADAAVRASVEDLKERQRERRKPNPQEAIDSISKLNASRDTLSYMAQSADKKSPEYQNIQKELAVTNNLIKFYQNFTQVETAKMGPQYAPQSAADWLSNAGFGEEE